MARKVVYCPYCSATNGAVKKAGALKIIHDKFRAKKTADEMEKWKKTFAPAVEAQKELAVYINKAIHEDLNPLKVLDLFRRISDEVCALCYGLSMSFIDHVRIVNCLGYIRPGAGQKSLCGNISRFPRSASVLPWLRMERPMKMILPLN